MTESVSPRFDRDEFARLYQAQRPQFAEAEKALTDAIKGIRSKVDPTGLVRTHLDEARVKSEESLASKAQTKGWTAGETVRNAPDVIGARVVCENLEDVARVAELLKEALGPRCSVLEVQIHDRKPDSGYRATHINGYVQIGSPLHPQYVPFEIQVRTLLQDAWGKLTHRDIYKGSDVPPLSRKMAEHLADLLDTADKIAQDIRADLTRRRVAPPSPPSVGRVTPEGVAFAFHEVFGRDPAEWAVQSLLSACEELGVTDMAALEYAIKDEPLRASLENAYRKRVDLPLGHERLLTLMATAASRGATAARRAVVKLAQREMAEADAYVRSMAIESLPDSVEEFLKQLDREHDDGDASHYLQSVAAALGVMSDCAICGAEIVDADGFETALYEHLGIDRDDGRVAEAVRNSGVEVGYWNSTSLCAYHGDQAAKDD